MEPYKVYISGPMQSKPGFNFHQFHEAQEWLESIAGRLHLGMFGSIEIVNPARNFDGDTTLGREVYLELALRQVDECHAIVLLPEWEESAGARLELARALHNGSQVFEWHPGTGGKRVFLPISQSAAQERLSETAIPMEPPFVETRMGKVYIEHALRPGEHPFYTINDARRAATEDHMLAWAKGQESHPDEDDPIAEPLAAWERELLESGLPDIILEKGAPETIEQEASRLVRNGERQKNYGHPRGDFDSIAYYWTGHLGGRLKELESLSAEDVAIMMMLLKIARLDSNPKHHDSKVDVIGYAICLDRLDEPQ